MNTITNLEKCIGVSEYNGRLNDVVKMTTKIKDLEIKTSKRIIKKEITEVTFDGFATEIEDLISLMDDLGKCDGFFECIVINDDKLRGKLEELQIIETGNKGDSSKGKNYNKFRKIFAKVIDKYWDDYDEDKK